MTKLAYLGTGRIGAALAEAAAKRGKQRGDEVVAWNRTRSKAEALQAFGVAVADTPADAVRGADRVHLAFPDDAIVEKVFAQFADVLGDDAVVVDHTPALPEATAERAARLAEGGIRYLHAPVMMSPTAARNGAGMMLVAGPEDVYDSVADALNEMAGKVRYFGPGMKRAAAFKLFGNCSLIALVGALADIFAMAESAGIDPGDALTLFDDFNPGVVLGYRGQAMAKGDYEAAFELTMARKDVRLMIETAGDRPLSVLPCLAERMDALIDAGHGDDDLGALAIDSVPAR